MHGVAHPAADQIAKRHAERLADEIERRRLDRGESARAGVERVFPRHKHRLRTRTAAPAALDHRNERAAESPRIRADEPRPHFLQRRRRSLAAVSLRDSRDPIVAFQLEDRAQRSRLMQPVARPQRRIGDGDFMDVDFSDAHGGRECCAVDRTTASVAVDCAHAFGGRGSNHASKLITTIADAAVRAARIQMSPIGIML